MEQENVQNATVENTEAKETKQEVAKSVEEKKYTDKQLNDISLKNEQKAVNKMLKELGIDDIEKAKGILAKAREEEEASKSLDEKTLELKKSKEKAELEAINSRIENAMLRKGIKDEKVERAVRLVDKKSILDEKGQLDQSKLNAEIEELLKDFPELVSKGVQEKVGFKIGADGKEDKPVDEMDKMRKIMGLK